MAINGYEQRWARFQTIEISLRSAITLVGTRAWTGV
jgi:hypothetical protein